MWRVRESSERAVRRVFLKAHCRENKREVVSTTTKAFYLRHKALHPDTTSIYLSHSKPKAQPPTHIVHYHFVIDSPYRVDSSIVSRRTCFQPKNIFYWSIRPARPQQNLSRYIIATVSITSTMSNKGGTPSKGPQSFPYDHLFKLLMIGDAGVGKVSERS